MNIGFLQMIEAPYNKQLQRTAMHKVPRHRDQRAAAIVAAKTKLRDK